MLRLDAAIRGDLRKFMAADIKAGEQAVTSAIRRRTTALKNNIRKGVRKAGLGQRLEKTIRAELYPERGASIGAKGLVYSKAIYKRPSGLVDLITTLDEGATIHPRGGKYLAIPLFERPGRKRQQASPDDFPKGTFRFVPVIEGKSALLIDRQTDQAKFFLVRRSRLRERGINVDAQIQKATRGLDDLIARNWEKRARRAGIL